MTYCLAWKKEDSIFFLSDSAVSSKSEQTLREKDPRDYNTFGEKQARYDQYYVYEQSNKITKIRDDIAVCFAGDVGDGYEMIRVFEECLSYGIDIYSAITSVYSSVSSERVQFVIGFMEYGRARLIKIEHGRIFEADMFEIGSGSEVAIWSDSVKRWLEFDFPIDHLLAIMVVLIQTDAMTKFMVPHGVGGTFNGFELNEKGGRWCPDLMYCLYTPRKISEGFISVINRNGLLATSSTFNSVTTMLTGYEHTKDNNEPSYVEIEQISSELSESITDYLILTNINQKKVLMVFINKWLHYPFLRMWKRDRGAEVDYMLVYDQEIIGDYIFSSRHGDDDEMSFHFLDIRNFKTEYLSLNDFEEMTGGKGNISNTSEYQ
ncbi:Proteasome subunit [Paenibacillus sp. UNCCL117]|uniref:hypothetical protein n=1 Tax=unclassified Paenibacillus TaxID=185978 RepID=UPI00089274CD|nr:MULTISPECIES: hypothetical protein [unclassified Paenibacillus]SDE68176.1 Proteasome subunit [Paenibacillus sp. cl123]SFW70909.1 Proteasome subunit [Paenibacillus sp. UNCCL117]